MTGVLDMGHKRITNVDNPIGPLDTVTLYFSDTRCLHLDGTYEMKNNINMDNHKIIKLKIPTNDTDAATKKYVDDAIPDNSPFIRKDGTVPMTGNLNLGNKKIVGLSTPTSNTDAATKKYVDDNKSGVGDITKDIDLKYSYNIKNSKKRTFDQLKAATESLVSYEEVRENFIGINEAEAMKTYLDMGDNLIYNVKTRSMANCKRPSSK